MEAINEYKYKRAKERVACIKSFYNHVIIYVLVISAIASLNYMTTSIPFVIFPALGWGIGLTAHGLRAFGYTPFLGTDWEERKIKEFMERDD